MAIRICEAGSRRSVSVGGALVSGTSWQMAQVVLNSAAVSSGAVALASAVTGRASANAGSSAAMALATRAAIVDRSGCRSLMFIVVAMSPGSRRRPPVSPHSLW